MNNTKENTDRVWVVEYAFSAAFSAEVRRELFLYEKEATEFFQSLQDYKYRNIYKTRDIWGFRQKKESFGKGGFVRNELSALLKKIDDFIIRAEYEHAENNEEYVFIYYRGNISPVKVCVTADSLEALARDVLTKI